MQADEKKALKTIASTFPKMDVRKKERFIGIAEGMALMADRQNDKNSTEKSSDNQKTV